MKKPTKTTIAIITISLAIIGLSQDAGAQSVRTKGKPSKLQIIAHGVVNAPFQDKKFSYHGWPTVGRIDDGTLIAVASLRYAHVDPFGKVVMYKSTDEGKTWDGPQVILETPMDDRDAGFANMGNGRLIVTSFNWPREQMRRWVDHYKDIKEIGLARLDAITDETEQQFVGGLAVASLDNGVTWSEPRKVPFCGVPHGPSPRRDGSLIVATRRLSSPPPKDSGQIKVFTSADGLDYTHLSDVSLPKDPNLAGCRFNEPHIIELKNGRLVMQIRVEGNAGTGVDKKRVFTICQTVSDDGGKTFSVPKVIGDVADQGAPPHLLQHSSGTVISTYARRRGGPPGILAMLSRDNGDTWEINLSLWIKGVSWDLGYPSSVELPGGDILTVYYAALAAREKPSLLWTRWRLPEQSARN